MGGRLAAALTVFAGSVVALSFAGVGPASAVGVTISPASRTVASGTPVTYTLSVTCDVNGGCTGTTVSFPSTTITGNGTVTDFASWVGGSSCPGVTRTVSGGVVTFTYGNLPTGTSQCTFTVTPLRWETLNGTQVTITPTIDGSNFDPESGGSATLNVTAQPGGGFSKSAPTRIGTGAQLSYGLNFACGPTQGSYLINQISVVDELPANFTFVSAQGSPPAAFPAGVVYDPLTHTVSYSGPAQLCNGSIIVRGTARTDNVPDEIGELIDNTASAEWTYYDGTTDSDESSTTTEVIELVRDVLKDAGSATLSNTGQYVFSGNGQTYEYTYPGDWDGSATSAWYRIRMITTGLNVGAMFEVNDSLPCLDDLVNRIYEPRPIGGPYCANPAFIPTRITATGFTPTTADEIVVVHPDGSTTNVAFDGTGWAIPTSPAVSEIHFQPFQSQGSNSASELNFVVFGHSAPGVEPDTLLENTLTSDAYMVDDDTTAIFHKEADDAHLLVADPDAGILVQPGITMTYNGGATCTGRVQIFRAGAPGIEIASVPSATIYVDWLAPAGVTVPDPVTPFVFAERSDNFTNATYTTPGITPTIIADYNGTGQTLYRWAIPAGTIQASGEYALYMASAMDINLGAGCAGTYRSSVTAGYGEQIHRCVQPAAVPPRTSTNPDDLRDNASPIAGNYCGAGAQFSVTPINPAFAVDKSVQGNLDATTINAGGVGNVSPSGGSATYDISFRNNGGSNLTDPVLYDLLPRVGDTRATSATPRNSQFAVELTGVGPVPAEVTVFYSTAANPCRPEVRPTNPGCVDDWTTTPPAPLSATTALKFEYSGTIYVNGASQTPNSFHIPYTVDTPDNILNQVAWNTVGTRARAGDQNMAPAESSTTGLRAIAAGLDLVKTADANVAHAAGDIVTYSFVVRNLTAVTLSGVQVTDTLTAPAGPALTITCPKTTLASGEPMTCTAPYTVTQADVDHGAIDNTAVASGTPPTGAAVNSQPSSAHIDIPGAPGLVLTKTANATLAQRAGDIINYSFLVTNNGNVTLTGVNVTDILVAPAGPALTVTCPDTTLDPREPVTCTAGPYTVTQADVDHGGITNTATAHGTPPTGPVQDSPPDTWDIDIAADPSLSVVKTANPTSAANAGDAIGYSFVVTNTGNVTLTGVNVTDVFTAPAGPALTVTCPDTTLDPGDPVTCTADPYTVTQADVDHGAIDNTATAHGTPPTGDEIDSPPSTAHVDIPANPSLTVVKTAEPDTAQLGDLITYSFLVTNTGNVPLTDINVTDVFTAPAGPALTVTCPDTTLDPGDPVTCTADPYTVTQADVDHGAIDNTATAHGTPPTGDEIDSPPSTAHVDIPANPDLTVVKTADRTTVDRAGDPINYSFLITNTGNVTLTDAQPVEQAFSGTGTLSAVSCPAAAAVLAPAQQVTCTASYLATQADVDSGVIINTATATATPPTGAAPFAGPSTVTITSTAAGVLALAKTATPVDLNNNGITDVGDRIDWTLTVTNTGTATVTGIVVSDPTAGDVTCPAASLAPGASMTCTTAGHLVTAADVAAGTVTNIATAAGTDANGESIASAPATATVAVQAVIPPPPPGTNPTTVPTPTELPATGNNANGMLSIGLILLAGGITLAVVVRRRRLAA